MVPKNKEERKAFWDALCAQLDSAIQANVEHLDRFAEMAETIFVERLEGKVDLTRKPPVGLRLLSADGAAILGVSPYFHRRDKQVVTNRMTLELSRQRQFTDRSGEISYQTFCPVKISKLQTWARTGNVWGSTTPADVETVAEICKAFVADPFAVMRRASDNCSICGRCLSDGESRARGIGPECIRRSYLWFKTPHAAIWSSELEAAC